MPAAIDITGQRYGRLTAIRRAAPRNKHTFWLFHCDCGVEKEIALAHVRGGAIRSCGCFLAEFLISEEHRAHCEHAARQPRTHGLSRTPVYAVWKTMHDRCRNPNNKDYRHYGGRGIRVCERWSDFPNFVADMGPRPDGMTIDREDNDGNYEPDNCRWATWSQQNLNKRDRIDASYSTAS